MVINQASRAAATSTSVRSPEMENLYAAAIAGFSVPETLVMGLANRT